MYRKSCILFVKIGKVLGILDFDFVFIYRSIDTPTPLPSTPHTNDVNRRFSIFLLFFVTFIYFVLHYYSILFI